MIGKFHLPISAGGALPDPATYCPANGYLDPDDPTSGVIWNPITEANGWYLIAEFQTNSPNTVTFDPSFTQTSGIYSWDLGDGYIVMDIVSIVHTYADSSTKTVKLYGKGTRSIYYQDFSNDNIVGNLDLSNTAFSALTTIIIASNALMTGVNFPSTMYGNVAQLQLQSTGLSGTVNLGMFTSFSTSAVVQLFSCPALTGITFSSTATGTLAYLLIYSTGYIGNLNVSMFTAFTNSATISLYLNPLMTSVTFASVITGMVNSMQIYSTGIIGVLDISKFTTYTATATVYLYSNTAMTGITFPSSTIAGFIRTLRIYECTSLGYVDLTKLRTGILNLGWQFQSNGWTAAIVNHILVDIDSMSASGFTGRVINIGGTNADPDTTSGGYDGIAARNSLIAKGFTVTIT